MTRIPSKMPPLLPSSHLWCRAPCLHSVTRVKGGDLHPYHSTTRLSRQPLSRAVFLSSTDIWLGAGRAAPRIRGALQAVSIPAISVGLQQVPHCHQAVCRQQQLLIPMDAWTLSMRPRVTGQANATTASSLIWDNSLLEIWSGLHGPDIEILGRPRWRRLLGFLC